MTARKKLFHNRFYKFCHYRTLITIITTSLLLWNCIAMKASAQTYNASVSTKGMQTVKGWGCNSYFATSSVPPEIIQDFYTELGMTIDRIYLDHNDGSDAAGNVNVAAMNEVCAKIKALESHGLRYMLCSWSPNISMKKPSIIGSADLRVGSEDAFTTYFVNICNFIKSKNLPLPLAISVQNEPTTTASYDSMHFIHEGRYDYSQYSRVVEQLRSKLDKNGFQNVKLLGPEDGAYDTGKNWGCSMTFFGGNGFPAFRTDSALKSAIWGCSSHSYNWGGGVIPLEQWAASCEKWHKDKWMTEYSYIENGEKDTPLIDIAVMATRRLCSDMACVRNNYWFWWDGYAPYIARNEVLVSDASPYTKYPLFYVLQKIFRNAVPGSVCHRVISNDPHLTTDDAIWMDAAAFVNRHGTTVVLVNPDRKTAATLDLSGLTGSKATIYQTTSEENMQQAATVSLVHKAIASLTLPPWSVTVVVTS